jgi:hypothetical protein
LDLGAVRELLRLDRAYYSATDDGVLRETISRLRVAGLQVLKRPTILADAVRKLSLKALYLPDQKRILLDESLPVLKHRWNEAHEIGHDVIPWHAGMMLGDTELTLAPACHAKMEAEANYAAGQILFLRDRFQSEARDYVPSITAVGKLKTVFGNTWTSTLWRFVEQAHPSVPMVAMVTGHPHLLRRAEDFDPTQPSKYCVSSPSFLDRFGTLSERALFRHVASYCGSQSGGMLGEAEITLKDRNGDEHVFHFETFFNTHQALTLAVYRRPVSA